MLQKEETTSLTVTYSPCRQCGLVNRVSLDRTGSAVCGSCKTELPLHGTINELSGGALSKLIQASPLPVVVDFWAPWCRPCHAFSPVFERASEELAGKVVFAKLNTEQQPLAASAYGIRGIPTLIVYKGGVEADRRSGAFPFEPFLGWLHQFL